jgi:glucosamine--fructose-6-phosphate aminotransferase (isomerizing)
MCGIVGYVGTKNCKDILLSGLQRLEYRGYDSAGLAILNNKTLSFIKKEGKLKILINFLKDKQFNGYTGIGHTRWATHGEPTDTNAHPHLDCSKKLAIVHNGIIENYSYLREKLKVEGHKFYSQTDTEVIAHLIEKYYKIKKNSLIEAVRKAVLQLDGSYALAVISTNENGKLIGARKGSPLVVGKGKNESFIASDVPALLPFTKEVLFIKDEEIVFIEKDKISLFDLKGKERKIKWTKVKWDLQQAEKGGCPHFMLKEIHEQKKAVYDTFAGRISKDKISFENLKLSKSFLKQVNRIFFVACGTAFYAGLTARYFVEDFLKIPAEAEIASEFRYRNIPLNKKTLVVVISQSGETADTIASLRKVKENGLKVLSVINVFGSTISRMSDGVIYTRAGIEIGVASTKAYTSQLTALFLLTLYLCKIKKTLSRNKILKFIKELKEIPKKIEKVLNLEERIKELAEKFYKKKSFLYLGRGYNYPNSLEGALKLKEISYIHAEGYPAGEMKHGPIALIDKNMPVVCLCPKGKTYEKVVSNIQEVKARKGIVVSLATQEDKEIKKFSDEVLYLPETIEPLTPLIYVIPLQLLAYYIAKNKNCDIDQPRNLAKSVTVE